MDTAHEFFWPCRIGFDSIKPPPRGPWGKPTRNGDRSGFGSVTGAGGGGIAARSAATCARSCSSCSRFSSVAATRAVSSGSAIGNLITRAADAARWRARWGHKCPPSRRLAGRLVNRAFVGLGDFLGCREFPRV